MGNTTTLDKNRNQLTNPEELTVLVFKDNDSARSFQIPLGWISRFGLFIGILVVLSLLTTFFAVKFYRVARRTDPSHVIDLEQEISELKIANKTLETKVTAVPVSTVTAPGPVPTVTVTVTPLTVAAAVATAAPAPIQTHPTAVASGGGAITLFSALPLKSQDLTANASKLPITISPAKTTWHGKALKVSFNIQYTASDKGSQQGRIVILARGPDNLLAYPSGVLNRAGSDSLIAPEQGEYFSVSRFRETHAEFGPIHSGAQIHDVEIMILSMEGQLLAYQKLPAPAVAVVAAPAKIKPSGTPAPSPASSTDSAAPAAAAPPSTTSPAKSATGNAELIEPGVDQ